MGRPLRPGAAHAPLLHSAREARAPGRPSNWAAAALAFTVLAVLEMLLFVYACTP